MADLLEGNLIVADKGYISQKDELMVYVEDEVRLIPQYQKMRGNSQKDGTLIRTYHLGIETVNSQLEKVDLQYLRACINEMKRLR